jgi:hypothetical protein
MSTVEQINVVLKDAAAQEKLVRLVQYFSKFLKWYYFTRNDKISSDRMVGLSTSMAMTRKVMRFPKSLDTVLSIRGSLSPRSLLALLQLLVKCCSLGYFFFDHFIWMHRVSLIQLDGQLQKRIQSLSDVSWVLECLVALCALALDRWRVNPGMSDKDKQKNLRSMIRTLVDLPLTIHFWRPEWTADYPEGLFGLLGTTSSLISLYDMWPNKK